MLLIPLFMVPPSFILSARFECFFKYLQVQLVSQLLFTFNKHLKQEQVGSMLLFALSLCLAACTRLMRILFTRCQQATHRSVCVFIEYMAACLDSNYWEFLGLFSEPK